MYSTPQKTLQTLIESFGLAIRLRVVRRAHEQLCVRQLEKLLPNMASGVPDGQRRATRVSVHDRLGGSGRDRSPPRGGGHGDGFMQRSLPNFRDVRLLRRSSSSRGDGAGG